MMATTHAVMGAAAVALFVAPTAPELAPVAALAAVLGGVFPDTDFLVAHRRTLHYPEGYWLLAAPVTLLAMLSPSMWTVAAAVFLASAGLHSVTDAFGGGLALRPWVEDDHRGVYSHALDRWIQPRRWIRYDGAPEDLALAVVCALPVVLTFDGSIRLVTYVLLVLSVLYTALRKQLPEFEARIR
jgi:hypothetical protein